MRELCCVWMIGIVIFMSSNGNLGAIYAGRFIAGLGAQPQAMLSIYRD